MKGETLMSMKDLAITMALFTIAVVAIVVVGFFVFKKWEKREAMRRGRQIAMASLDPNCVDVSSRRNNG
jgi:predicted Kef-type K+ transport protein